MDAVAGSKARKSIPAVSVLGLLPTKVYSKPKMEEKSLQPVFQRGPASSAGSEWFPIATGEMFSVEKGNCGGNVDACSWKTEYVFESAGATWEESSFIKSRPVPRVGCGQLGHGMVSCPVLWNTAGGKVNHDAKPASLCAVAPSNQEKIPVMPTGKLARAAEHMKPAVMSPNGHLGEVASRGKVEEPLLSQRTQVKMATTTAEGRTAVLIFIFALVTFLIILNANNSEEPFNYKDLKIKHHNPPNIRKWGIQDGYIPVSGNKTLHSKCNSCVLVTSSSHLLNTGLGPKIDQAECIIRMNDAPTTGYEKDVGNKTTFRVVAHSSVYRVLRRPQEFLSRAPRQTLIFWGPPTKMLQNSKANLYHIIERASSAFPNVSAFVLSPRNMMRFDELFRAETGRDREKSHSWLSTGWFTMVIAVELCNNLHVYGMVPPNYCSLSPRQHKMPYHYYEPRGSDECTTYIQNERGRQGNHHRFITEKLVFARWASVYNISFSHPEWFKDADNSN